MKMAISFLPLVCSIVMAVAALLMYYRLRISGILTIGAGYALNSISGITNLVLFGMLVNLVFEDTAMVPKLIEVVSWVALFGLMVAAAGFVVLLLQTSKRANHQGDA